MKTLALSLAALSSCSYSWGVTILSVDGPDEDSPLIWSDQAAAISFELDRPFYGVAFEALITCVECEGFVTLLSSEVGSALPSDIVYSAPFDAADFNVGGFTTLFSGLDLLASSYHLIVSIDTPFAVWTGTRTSTLSAVDGVSYGASWFATDANQGFPGDSNFVERSGTALLFRLTAEERVDGVPVPDSGAGALAFGVALLALFGLRRSEA